MSFLLTTLVTAMILHAFTKKDFLHKHRCPNCAHVWEHCKPERAAKKAAHTCAQCGTVQYWKYFGKCQPKNSVAHRA